MITNIDIDAAVVAEAMRLSGARTKREVVDRALRELVARASRPSVRELFGIGGVDPDYDPKTPWARGAQVGQNRVEQPRSNYNKTPVPPAPESVGNSADSATKKPARPARPKKS